MAAAFAALRLAARGAAGLAARGGGPRARPALAGAPGGAYGGVQRRFRGSDSHDDFAPQSNVDVGSVDDAIRKDISSNRVFLYMKGVPEAPQCGFSNMVVQILDVYGAEYGSRNVLEDPELREGIKAFSSWPTIPQVYVDGEFVGGADIMMQLHQQGELSGVLGVKEE